MVLFPVNYPTEVHFPTIFVMLNGKMFEAGGEGLFTPIPSSSFVPYFENLCLLESKKILARLARFHQIKKSIAFLLVSIQTP